MTQRNNGVDSAWQLLPSELRSNERVVCFSELYFKAVYYPDRSFLFIYYMAIYMAIFYM